MVIRRRTAFLLRKAEERKHIVEGLRIAVDNIDEVIRIIRASADTDAAKQGLMSAFSLSLAQAQAIVDMRLGRLTGLEREKLEKEYNDLLAEIADLQDILARDERVRAIILEDLDDIEKKFGDPRRTEISLEEIDGSFDIEELITEELMVVTFSRGGYVKRVALDAYRAQGRGGRGVKGSESKEGDALKSVFAAGTHDYLLFFSNRGKVYWQKVYQLPEGSRTSTGRAIQNVLPLAKGETIQSVLRVREFDTESAIVFATKRGIVKKTLLEAYSRPRTAGIWAIVLDEGDELMGVELVRPGDTVLVGTAEGRMIRFDEAAARTMGRTSRGVRGIKLKPEDKVVGMLVGHAEELTVVTACSKGYGKRTPLSDYPIKGRGGQGVINIKTTSRNGEVIGIASAHDDDEVMLITHSGMLVRSPIVEMRPMGRNTQGVRLVNLKSEDELVGIEIVSSRDLEEFATDELEGEAGSAVMADADAADAGAADDSNEEDE